MPDTGEKSSYNDNEVSVFQFINNFKTMAMCAMMILLKIPQKKLDRAHTTHSPTP